MSDTALAGHTLTSDVVKVLEFVNSIMKLTASADMKGIGMLRGDRMVSGVVYEGYNQHNIWMHCAAVPGRHWLTRVFLEAVFGYPFLQLGVKRVSAYVDASNKAARKFDEHLGFKLEATLSGAARDGGDVLIYVMRLEDCRFLRNDHGQ